MIRCLKRANIPVLVHVLFGRLRHHDLKVERKTLSNIEFKFAKDA